MTKLAIYTVFIFGASLINKTELPNNISPAHLNDKVANVETTITSTVDYETADKDYYSEYLHVLGINGPKESDISNKMDKAEINVEKQAVSSEPINAKVKEIITETQNNVIEEKEELIGSVNHSAFGKLLKKHVNSKGDVNYNGFKKDIAELDAYLNQLQSNPVNPTMSKNERLAYWINVYNAFTIKLILDNYPVKSIQDIANGKPWDKVFIKLGNTSYSLNNIENGIIRQKFTEPRIHFAVNCAAKSCPPLLNDAYYPETLIDQLSERTKSFISNNSYNTITKNTLKVSKIFDWYGKDFGDVKRYIERHVDVDVSGLELQFKEYDWALNKQ